MTQMDAKQLNTRTDASEILRTDAVRCLDELRSSIGELISAIRPSIRRASELERVLGTDKRLSWSVFTAATTRDTRTLVSLLPGARAMGKFLDAALARGVPQETVERASSAFKNFEEVIAHHSDERDAFQLMIEDLLPGTEGLSAEVELRNRRAAYRANSLLWGMQVKTMTVVSIVKPGSSPNVLDRLDIAGKSGIRQNRLHSPLHIEYRFARKQDPGDENVAEMSVEPLDPTMLGAADRMPLMPSFCSQPLPVFRTMIGPGDMHCQRLVSRGLGSEGESTHYFGSILRNWSANPRVVPGATISSVCAFRHPIGLFIHDVLLHESVWDGQPGRVKLSAERPDVDFKPQEQDMVPARELVELLGTGIEVARTLELPRHTELLEYAFERSGWNPNEFKVFRCRVEYPILNSLLILSFC